MKSLFLLPDVVHLTFRSSFSAHLSADMKEWMIVQLDLGLSVQQVMAHHRKKLFQRMSQM